MHEILFSLKRADQASRALQRRLLHPFGITPARYDLIFLIFHRGRGLMEMDQSAVRKELGVTAPTTCRMVKGLERQGLVTCKRVEWGDRRQVRVALTALAVHIIRSVRKRIIRRGTLWLTFYTAFRRCVSDMGTLHFLTTHLREALDDPGTYYFPYQRERRVGKWWACERRLWPTYTMEISLPRYSTTSTSAGPMVR